MENGEWKMENGECRLRIKSKHPQKNSPLVGASPPNQTWWKEKQRGGLTSMV